jgi:hypothetical protein
VGVIIGRNGSLVKSIKPLPRFYPSIAFREKWNKMQSSLVIDGTTLSVWMRWIITV